MRTSMQLDLESRVAAVDRPHVLTLHGIWLWTDPTNHSFGPWSWTALL